MDNLHIVNLSSYNRPKVQEDKKKRTGSLTGPTIITTSTL